MELAQGVSLIYILRDFGYKNANIKYDPWYRDAIDWNQYDNRLNAPLDLYMGYKGYSIGFSEV